MPTATVPLTFAALPEMSPLILEPAKEVIKVGSEYDPVVTTPLVTVAALPDKLAVIVPAEKLPEASRATIVLAVFAEVALLVTVNVLLPDWLAVKLADPVSPVPDTPRDNAPLLIAGKVVHVWSPRRYVDADAVPDANRAVPTVPVDRLEAFKLVSELLAPLIVLFVSVWVPVNVATVLSTAKVVLDRVNPVPAE